MFITGLDELGVDLSTADMTATLLRQRRWPSRQREPGEGTRAAHLARARGAEGLASKGV